MRVQAAGASYLESCLAPLAGYLSQHDVTDVYINRPGELWVETLDCEPVRHDAPELTETLLARLARQIAAVSAQGVNREHPLLAASLPTGERVQIALPPATRGHIAFAIRKHVSAGFSLQDYETAGAFTIVQKGNSAPTRRDVGTLAQDNPAASLREAVRERRNILISGGRRAERRPSSTHCCKKSLAMSG